VNIESLSDKQKLVMKLLEENEFSGDSKEGACEFYFTLIYKNEDTRSTLQVTNDYQYLLKP
jgi:hypothetical protein